MAYVSSSSESDLSSSETDSGDSSSSDFNSLPSPPPIPVMVEARAGNAKKLESLLAQGSDYTSKDRVGCRPLLEAARAGHLDCVKVLLEAARRDYSSSEAILENVCPVSPVPTDDDEYPRTESPLINEATPISAAAANGHWKVVDVLTDLYSKSTAEETAFALYRACSEKQIKCIRLLANKFPQHMSEKCPRGPADIPIQISARRGDLVAVETLLQAGKKIKYTDVNTMVDYCGQTPLHYAAESGNLDLVLMLLRRGANPRTRAKTSYGLNFTPLTTAAAHGRLEVVAVLLDLTPREWEAVFMAAYHSCVDCLKYLLNKGFPTFDRNFPAPSFQAYDCKIPWDLILYKWQRYNNICDTIKILLDHGTNFEELATSNELSILPNHLNFVNDNTLEVFLEYGLIELKWGSQDHPDISLFTKLVGETGVRFFRTMVYEGAPAFYADILRVFLSMEIEIFLININLYMKFFPFTTFSCENPPVFETLESLEASVVPIVPKLSELCRWTIRCCIVRIHKMISPELAGRLPLPKALQNFLLYKKSRKRIYRFEEEQEISRKRSHDLHENSAN